VKEEGGGDLGSPDLERAVRPTSPRQRDILKGAVAAIAEQSAEADAVVDEALAARS
jgi:hypothetical protein